MFKARNIRFGGRGVASDTITNTDLANVAAGTVKGRALGAGTGDPQDLAGNQVGELIRVSTDVSDTSSGTNNAFAVAATTTSVQFAPSGGALTIGGVTLEAGQEVYFRVSRVATNPVILKHNSGGSGAALLRCPLAQDIVLWPNDGVILRPCFGAVMVEGTLPSIQSPLIFYVNCPSGGSSGTPDDVTIWNANSPANLRILDAQLRVSTAVGGSSAALRTASGGGGSVVLPDPGTATQTFSTASTGVLEDLATATATVALNGSLFLRRSDRSVVGELTLTCIRTS